MRVQSFQESWKQKQKNREINTSASTGTGTGTRGGGRGLTLMVHERPTGIQQVQSGLLHLAARVALVVLAALL